MDGKAYVTVTRGSYFQWTGWKDLMTLRTGQSYPSQPRRLTFGFNAGYDMT